MKRYLYILLFVFSFLTVYSQESNKDIPRNLDECFITLDNILPKESQELILSYTNEDEMINFHFSLGMWMRNNWGLWGGSELSKWFTNIGIFHPDDMSGIILTSYWRKKHSVDINLDEQIKYYQNYWNNIKPIQINQYFENNIRKNVT